MDKTNLNSNNRIYDAIRQIAWHKLINKQSNSLGNGKKIFGYVQKIHTEGELCGTVDVMEYIDPADFADKKGDDIPGMHKGVYLSAIQKNESGIVIVPFLYSDVIIEVEPVTLREYVVQYSHADKIQIDAHNQISIGVTETEEFEETEDSPDFDELKKTGVRSNTTYTPTSILNMVAKGDGDGDSSKVEITPDSVLSEHDKAKILLDAKQILAKYNAKEIVIKEDGVCLGKGDATEPAVLGDQLASLLLDWLSAMTQMVTPTMMGPQPPANLAQFITLQMKVNAFKSSLSGFLSKSVKVAK